MRESDTGALEEGVRQWRASLTRGRVIDTADLDELEGHLRDQAEELVASGLSEDEAFLIALKRLGAADRLTAEFATMFAASTPLPPSSRASTAIGCGSSWCSHPRRTRRTRGRGIRSS